jgi:hypothetical protein
MLHPRVPRSVVRTSRTEHTRLPLDRIDGAIPNDLSGHLFVVSPAGTFRPDDIAQRTTLMVGDGLVSRFDLSPSGISVTSKLMRTHDFVADEITSADDSLELFRFVSAGLVRLGLLGTRDFANTAFVPMKDRMLVTYDAGRPMEIDPSSLDLLGPVGGRHEWRPEALPEAAFPIVLSPAHPAFDRRRGELFTVNYGRGVLNFAATIPLVYALERVPRMLEVALDRIASIAGIDSAYRFILRQIERFTTRIDRALQDFVGDHLPMIPVTFTDLVRWDTTGRLERFRLVLPNGDEVGILQSVHQVAVTRDHVIVLETGFKIGMQSAFNDPAPREPALDRLLRAVLTRPQLPSTVFYVVPRAALDDPNLPRTHDGLPQVVCRRVEIPLEADHFLADYDDTNGITLHVAHSPATDLAEWVRPYDVSIWRGADIDDDLHGMLAVGAMDVGRFGRYVIDGATGTVTSSRTMLDDERSWAIALYAGRGLNTDAALPDRIDHLYWCTEGFFPELLTDFVYDLYARYPHRQVPTSEIRAMSSTGRPSAVLRIDTGSLSIGDGYVLGPGVMAGSMQWMPGGRDGYLIGTVYTEARTELWIFDAGALARGPIARLAARALDLGFSLHTAWVPSVAPSTTSYRVTAREELARHVHDPRLRREFERNLYPRFE